MSRLLISWENADTDELFALPYFGYLPDRLAATLDQIDVDYWHHGITVYAHTGEIMMTVKPNSGASLHGGHA